MEKKDENKTEQGNKYDLENFESKVVKKYKIKRVVKGTSLTIAAAALVFSLGVFGGSTLYYRKLHNDLPKISDAENNLNGSGYSTEISWLDDERFVFPLSGKLKVNVYIPKEKLTEEVKSALEESVEEMNDVLAMIDKDYRLVINYKPKFFDDTYCFDLYDADLTYYSMEKGGRALGNASTISSAKTVNGYGKYRVKVNVDLDYCRENYKSDEDYHNVLISVLCHEILGHGIGSFKDAYKLDDYKYRTIMEGANSREVYFSKSDLMMLFSKYSNNNNYESWESKIEEYYKGKDWYKEIAENVNYVKEHIYDDYVIKNGLEEYIKPEDIVFEDIGEFYASSSDAYYGVSIDDRKSYIQRNASYNMIKSEDKLSTFFCVTLGVDNLYKAEYDDYIYNINGVTCTKNGVFAKINDETIIEANIGEDENGDICIKYFKTYDSITKEQYENNLKNINKVLAEFKEFSSYYDYVSEKAASYFEKEGISYTLIKEILNEISTQRLSYYVGSDYDDIKITDDNFTINNRSFSYEIKNGIVVISNEEIMIKTPSKLIMYRMFFDVETGETYFKECGIIPNYNKADFASEKMQTKVNGDN